MCTCIAGQLLLWQMRNALGCWGFFHANCQRKFAPEFFCTETYRRAYKSQRLQCSTNCDGTASECIYIYVHLYLFYFIIHVWPLFCTWCLSSIHVISITISTYLDLDLQIGGAWVQSGKALQSSVRIKQWHCTFSQYARYGQINDARCFSVPWTNLCCPLAPGVCVLEACLHLVWRILATV